MCAHRASHHHEPRPDAAGAFCSSEASSDGGTGRRQGHPPTPQRTPTPHAGWERGVRGEGRAATWALPPLVTFPFSPFSLFFLLYPLPLSFLSPFFLLYHYHAEPRRRPEQCAAALCCLPERACACSSWHLERAWQCRPWHVERACRVAYRVPIGSLRVSLSDAFLLLVSSFSVSLPSVRVTTSN